MFLDTGLKDSKLLTYSIVFPSVKELTQQAIMWLKILTYDNIEQTFLQGFLAILLQNFWKIFKKSFLITINIY